MSDLQEKMILVTIQHGDAEAQKTSVQVIFSEPQRLRVETDFDL
jgi:hypothetical protein